VNFNKKPRSECLDWKIRNAARTFEFRGILAQESLGRPRRRWKDNVKINTFENTIRERQLYEFGPRPVQ